MKEELNCYCIKKKKPFADHWFDCFPAGFLTSLLIVLFDTIYVFITNPGCKDRGVLNIFHSLLALSILNAIVTPILLASVLTIKDRLNIKFKFRQTYKFK